MRKIIFPLFFLLTLSVFLTVLFFVKINISCRSQYGACPEEVAGGFSKYQSGSLLATKNGISDFLKKNYLVSGYSFQFKLPGTLLINLVVRKPQYALADKVSGNIGLIDKSGTVLGINKDSTLPRVTGVEALPAPGGKVSDAMLFALKLMGGVFQLYQVNEGEIQDDSLVVDIDSHIRVLFPLGGEDTQVLLGALRLIYPRVTSGDLAGKFSQIDLRFKNPVLR